MRAWIRKHRIGAMLLAVLTLAGMGYVLVFFYFTYCFSLRWANATGDVQSGRQGVTATYTYRRSLRSFTPCVDAGRGGPVYDSSGAGAST
jgi:hypothetical protein